MTTSDHTALVPHPGSSAVVLPLGAVAASGAEAVAAPRALDRSLARGLAWTGGIKWAGQLLSWATTIIVARLLTPADYGLVGMATLYLSLATLLSEFGMGAAIVTIRDLTKQQIAQINTVSVLFGIAAFVISCGTAWPLGKFFHAPALPAVVIAMSVTFIVGGFKTVPSSLLQRDLAFKRIAMIDGIQTIVLSLGMLVSAFLGFGYWTLVLGAVVSAIVSTTLYVAQRPFPFGRPTIVSLRRSLTFSWHVLLQRVSFFAYSDADFLVVGKMIGQAPLGAYTFAWTLANVPIEKITSLITAVTPAIFSAVQSDQAALRRYLLSISEGIAYFTLPATIGLALVAPEIVRLVLGEQWISMIGPLRLLAAYACVRSLTPLLMQLANATGESRFGAQANLTAAIVLPTSFALGSRWGTVGVAVAWMIVHPLVIVIPLSLRVFARIDLPVRTYLAALWPSISGTLLMTAVVLVVQLTIPSQTALALRFLVQVVAGVLAYVLVLTAGHTQRLRTALATWKAIRS